MSSAKKVRLMVTIALALTLPFAMYEVYVVMRFGFADPYSYYFSVPAGVVSFLLLQFAIGYSAVKGWVACAMPRNYFFLLIWLTSLLVLFFLPDFFPGGPLI